MKERYDIDITVDIYREMLRQIKDENLHTYDENSLLYIKGGTNARHVERHLLYIEGQNILAVYLGVKNSLDTCILTVLPKSHFNEVRTEGLIKHK